MRTLRTLIHCCETTGAAALNWNARGPLASSPSVSLSGALLGQSREWTLYGQRMLGGPQGSTPLSGHQERPHWTCVQLPLPGYRSPCPALTFPSTTFLCLPNFLFLCLCETLLKGRLTEGGFKMTGVELSRVPDFSE